MSFGLSGVVVVPELASGDADSAAGMTIVLVLGAGVARRGERGARARDDQQAGEGQDEGGAIALHEDLREGHGQTAAR